MSYTIDREQRLVRTRGWGVLTTHDLQDVTSRMLADPRFDPEFRSLGDLSDVTSITVDSMAVAQTASTPLFNPGTRRAIVATCDIAFGMARMFATFSERAGQEVRVFREMRLAEAWLGLQPSPQPDSANPAQP